MDSAVLIIIIGLPSKNELDNPLSDYERIIFDSLVQSSFDIRIGNSS
jgi:hypothetical protein